MKQYRTIGVMSGTSLDGLDIAYCRFWKHDEQWKYAVDEAVTIEFEATMRHRLLQAKKLSAKELLVLHNDFGKWIGQEVAKFINTYALSVDFIASHGHTVFHQPEHKLNLQIGQPLLIKQETGSLVIADFRTPNILAGGQGAPLVPIGDKYLFSQYDYCVNIGGFANISFDDADGRRMAFDVSPANLIFNFLAQQYGCYFDKNGKIGRSGKVDEKLLKQLNALPYYHQKYPKSLGAEWFETAFLPLFEASGTSIPDKLRTAYEHLVSQLTKVIQPGKKVLLTGGGALNTALVDLLFEKCACEITIPNRVEIEFKEALIFAFLGVLKMEHQVNCLASYTGAPQDMICGTLY